LHPHPGLLDGLAHGRVDGALAHVYAAAGQLALATVSSADEEEPVLLIADGDESRRHHAVCSRGVRVMEMHLTSHCVGRALADPRFCSCVNVRRRADVIHDRLPPCGVSERAWRNPESVTSPNGGEGQAHPDSDETCVESAINRSTPGSTHAVTRRPGSVGRFRQSMLLSSRRPAGLQRSANVAHSGDGPPFTRPGGATMGTRSCTLIG
jgi:hypothetical protein